MGKGLKLLVSGLFGLLAVFAFVGVKSMLGDHPMVVQDNGFVEATPEGSIVGTNGNISGQDVPATGTDVEIPVTVVEPATDTETGTGNNQAASTVGTDGNISGQDVPATGTDVEIPVTLVEPATDTETGTDNNQAASTQTQAETLTSAQTQTQTGSNSATADTSNSDNSDDAASTDNSVELVEDIGKLALTITDPATPDGLVEGEFLVYDAQDLQVASLSGGDTASFDLPPGTYRVVVSANGKESSRKLGVYKDKLTNARFELPSAAKSTTTTPEVAEVSTKGQLLVTVRAAEGSSPIKANIYVQKSNGTHVAKKNYDDSADFLLEAGSYKVTIKADGRKDIVRDIKVGANGVVRETFAMQLPAAAPAPVIQQAPVVQAPTPRPPATQQPAAVEEGTLRVELRSEPGLPDRARFVVRDENGARLANIDPTSEANVALPPGTYEVIAALGRGQRQSRIIDISAGKTSRLSFNAADIVQPEGQPDRQVTEVIPDNVNQQQTTPPATQETSQPPAATGGLLQLNAVSGLNGQPLKVNFTVSTQQGALIQTFNNVSYAEISVPVQNVVVGINYETMNGREVINIKPNGPTPFTFTITPNGAQ